MGAKFVHDTQQWADILGKLCLHSWSLATVTCVALFAPLLLVLEFFDGSLNFRTWNHPTPQGIGVFSETNNSIISISSNAGVVLLMFWSIWIDENALFVHCTVKLPAANSLATNGCLIGSSALSSRCTVIQPPGIIRVVQRMEPWGNVVLLGMSSTTNFESLALALKVKSLVNFPGQLRATQTMTWRQLKLHATVSLIALSLWHCLIKCSLYELVPPLSSYGSRQG